MVLHFLSFFDILFAPAKQVSVKRVKLYSWMNVSHEFGLQTREVVNHGAWVEVEEMAVCALALSHCCQGLARILASHRKACIIEALCLDDNSV